MIDNKNNNDPYFVIIIDGGLGDHICSTYMIMKAKQQMKNKKIIVGAFHPDIFLNNPHIDSLYNITKLNDMYEKYIKPLKNFGSVRKRDIYNVGGNKLWKGKLSELWCYNYGIEYKRGEDLIKLYLSDKEKEEAKNIIDSFSNKRQVVIIQPFGATVVYERDKKITNNKDWFVDYWTVVNKVLSEKYNVIQVGSSNEPNLKYCYNLQGKISIRQTIGLINECKTYISVDSFVGHSGAALNKKGIVLFGRSNPHIVGHSGNINLWVENSCDKNDLFCCRPAGYFADYKMTNGQISLWECPLRTCMIELKPQLVIEKLKEIIEL